MVEKKIIENSKSKKLGQNYPYLNIRVGYKKI